MHHRNLVIIEQESAQKNLEQAVYKAMGPHEDDGGFWDWFQIGGRWTGTLSGYKPKDDPKNTETCFLCNGTGKRTDMSVADGCNGCAGKGQRSKWPTQWARHEGDVMPIEKLTEEQLKEFYRIVTPYCHYESRRYEPWADEKFRKMDMPTLQWLQEEFAGHICVVVDNHS